VTDFSNDFGPDFDTVDTRADDKGVALPAQNPVAKALRGWPSSPAKAPNVPAQVDWSNADARGLNWLIASGSEIVGKALVETNLPAEKAIKPFRGALALWGSGTTDSEFSNSLVSQSDDNSGAFTLAGSWIHTSNSYFIPIFYSGGATPLFVGIRSSNKLYVRVGTADYTSSIAAPSLNEVHTFAVAWDDSNSPDRLRLFLDGELQSSTNWATSSITWDAPVLWRTETVDWHSPEGYLINLGFWGRQISDEEVARRHRDFYALLKPANQAPLYFPQVAASSVEQLVLPADSPVTRALRGYPQGLPAWVGRGLSLELNTSVAKNVSGLILPANGLARRHNNALMTVGATPHPDRGGTYFDGSGDYLYTDIDPITWAEYDVIHLVTRTLPVDARQIIGLADPASSTKYLNLGTRGLDIREDGETRLLTSGGYDAASDRGLNVLSWWQDGNSARYYLNGRFVHSDAGTARPTVSRLSINRIMDSSPAAGIAGWTFLGYMKTKAGSVEQVLDFHRNPHNYLRPANQTPLTILRDTPAEPKSFALPGYSDVVKALRGWPSSPTVKPSVPVAIDWSSPYARGLFNCFYLGQTALDIVDNTPPTVDNSSVITTQIGLARQYVESSSTYTRWSGSRKITALPVSMVCRFRIDETPASTKSIFQTHATTTSSDYYTGFTLTYTTSRTLTIHLGNSGSSSSDRRSHSTSEVLTIGQWYTVAVCARSVTDVSVFLDGNEISTTPSGTASFVEFPDNHYPQAGFWDSNLNRYADCAIAIISVYNQAHADGPLAELSKNAYLPLIPASQAPMPFTFEAVDATGIPVLSLPIYNTVLETSAIVGCTVTY